MVVLCSVFCWSVENKCFKTLCMSVFYSAVLARRAVVLNHLLPGHFLGFQVLTLSLNAWAASGTATVTNMFYKMSGRLLKTSSSRCCVLFVDNIAYYRPHPSEVYFQKCTFNPVLQKGTFQPHLSEVEFIFVDISFVKRNSGKQASKQASKQARILGTT